MPRMFLAAVADETKVGLLDALIYSGLGILIVFAVLLVLMAFITIMSKLIKAGGKGAGAAAASAGAPAAESGEKRAPAATKPADSAVPQGTMLVSVGGKKHTVTVTEKLPRFSVTLNGRTHAVDVEECGKEDADK